MSRYLYLALLLFAALGVNAQGTRVAQDLRRYIEAPAPAAAQHHGAGTETNVTYDVDDADPGYGETYRSSHGTGSSTGHSLGSGTGTGVGSGVRPSFTRLDTLTIGGQEVNDAESVIYSALAMRPSCDSMVAVVDFTGSMYPYLGQVVRWQKYQAGNSRLAQIVLFNDGDSRPDGPIGATGGIYYAAPDSLDALLATVERVVDAGKGGGSPENDLEAVLAAIARNPAAPGVILIGDASPVRDIDLLARVSKPVHVILCNDGLVGDYVRIAYQTRGSITTPSGYLDFANPAGLNLSALDFAGATYRLTGE